MKIQLILLLSWAISVHCIRRELFKDCESDDDCKFYSSCDDGKCLHKGLLPLDGREIGGSIVIAVSIAFSSAAGVGGGPILITIMLIIFNFETHNSIPLSQTIVFGMSIVSTGMKITARHPTRDKPLIAWGLVMHLASPLLLGASIGVMLNLIFPEWLLIALLVIVVGSLSSLVFKRGFKLYKLETIAKRNKQKADAQIQEDKKMAENQVDQDSNQTPNQEKKDLVLESENESNVLVAINTSNQENNANSDNPVDVVDPKLSKVLNRDKSVVNWLESGILVSIFSWVVLCSCIRGDKTFKSIAKFEICSNDYWGFLSFFYLSLVCISILTAFYVVKKTQHLKKLSYDFDEFDLVFTKKVATQFTFISLFAGFMAGMVGIGGGLIVGPLMLIFKVRPDVSAATSGVIIIITSTISVFLNLIADTVELEYAG